MLNLLYIVPNHFMTYCQKWDNIHLSCFMLTLSNDVFPMCITIYNPSGFKPEFEKWPSKMCSRGCSNKQFIRQHIRNKIICYRKWPSTGHLDAHLAKSLNPFLFWKICIFKIRLDINYNNTLGTLFSQWGAFQFISVLIYTDLWLV